MFTGIVEEIGVVAASHAVPGGRRLSVRAKLIPANLPLGASVSVNGVCLTVTARDGDTISFDVIAETLSRSSLGRLTTGDRVNLERSLPAGGRLDGHFVQGHVDGLALVEQVRATPQEWVAWFRPPEVLMAYLVPKGSVAVEGVSLTIADLDDHRFSVALIPTTLQRTTLAVLRGGEHVNIETDILSRTVVHTLSRWSAGRGLTLDTLRNTGFA